MDRRTLFERYEPGDGASDQARDTQDLERHHDGARKYASIFRKFRKTLTVQHRWSLLRELNYM